MHDGGASVEGLEALREALRAQASTLDRLLQAIAGEYGDERRRAGRSPERRRVELVRGLLDGGGGEVGGEGLGYELEGRWHLGVIATGVGAAQVVRGLAVSGDRRLLSVAQGRESVWAWLGGGERFAVGEIERAIVEVVRVSGVSLAVGEPAWGLAGWRLSHRQAQAALVVALRRNRISRNGAPPAGVTRYADVALLAAALKDEALGRALVEVYLDPLEGGDSGERGAVLRETLRAYMAAERSVSSAAAALGVARTTLEGRLRTVEERLGRTLHPFPLELELALALGELGVASSARGFVGGGKFV